MPKRIHNMSRTPTYGSWASMLQRCYNPKAVAYEHYGARGISVCDRWRYGEDDVHPFLCFMRDMGERPAGLTLDRLNPNDHYTPATCRWATPLQQANNRRGNYFVCFEGVTRSVYDWKEALHDDPAMLDKVFSEGADVYYETKCAIEKPADYRKAGSRLTPDDVREIRYLADKIPHIDIAQRYGIHRSYVSGVARYDTWRHVKSDGWHPADDVILFWHEVFLRDVSIANPEFMERINRAA